MIARSYENDTEQFKGPNVLRMYKVHVEFAHNVHAFYLYEMYKFMVHLIASLVR